MKKLWDSHFQDLYYDPTAKLFKQRWLGTTYEMDEQRYQREQQKMLGYLKESQPEKLLVDLSNFAFIIVPELQAWHTIHIHYAIIQLGIHKIAFLMSPDFVAQTSVEQTVDEFPPVTTTKIEYFSNLQEAETWLKTS